MKKNIKIFLTIVITILMLLVVLQSDSKAEVLTHQFQKLLQQ